MLNKSPSLVSLLLGCAVLLTTFAGTRPPCNADQCPTTTDEIATDRPDVTNSSLVVPRGSLQAENGVDWTVRHDANALDGTNTRLRFGVVHCTELLIDLPNYFSSLNGGEASGFSNVVVSFRRQLPVPFGFGLAATAGLGFPSGSSRIWVKVTNPTCSSPGPTASLGTGKSSACSP